MTTILGISAFFHDAAAALVVDGNIVAAAEEERFTRLKHDASFPTQAIAACLTQAGLTAEAIDYVAFYEKPLLKFDRLMETFLSTAPRGFPSFVKAVPQWLHQKLFLRREIRRGLNDTYQRQCLFPEHHESHAASAFYPSPFENAAILTIDGVGEWATATIGEGRGNTIRLTHELRFPHSPGLLYSAFTHYCGFKVNSGEYKLMGLAPYGTPKYVDLIYEHLVDLKPDGSFFLNQRYFDYLAGTRMISKRFQRLFGAPPRVPESPITEREMDLAASIQVVLEEIVLRMARTAHRWTGQSALCLAGGVALNCVANRHLQCKGPFEKLWIQPAAGDAGGALGAALLVWHQLLGQPRVVQEHDAQHGSLLGPSTTAAEIRSSLEELHVVAEPIEDESERLQTVARLLAEGKIVGWFQGRMEFGPRALGARSLLADPQPVTMQRVMNEKIKLREAFRPFAPAVLQERAVDYFNLPSGADSPYMLLVADVQPTQRITIDDTATDARGFALLNQRRSTIPAVTHVDYSARVQTVDPQRNRPFYQLLKVFESLTGCPVLINTSFNVRGEPLVCSPADAIRCFLSTEIDALVLEDYLMLKSAQSPEVLSQWNHQASRFTLD
ncbi:hypothetical protein GC163_21960 [bacterium]|nr:hypothetical protein [bacterium]